MSESVAGSLQTEKTSLEFINKTKKINKDYLFIFFFRLQNVSKSQIIAI